MATGEMTAFMAKVRTVALRHDGLALPDEQLLASYVERHDEAAFAAIVRRHGAMVMAVCRRILADRHDAEDAFQATFLVLVRKAGSIATRGLLANWLHGVAYNMALKARSTAARHRAREVPVAVMPEREAVLREGIWHDLLPLLDQELSRLPDKYRVPIILGDLEAKAHKEAAQYLGWPVGTVSGRLARARKMLAKRLARHGLNLSAASLAMLLGQHAASASVSTALVSSTVKVATLFAVGEATGVISSKVAALTQGALTSMFFTQLKTVTAVMLGATMLGAGAGVLGYGSNAPMAAEVTEPPTNKTQAPKGAPATAAPNILKNGGIEEGDQSPAHWSQGADVEGVRYIWDKHAGYKSKASLCLHKTANRYFPIAQWYQVVDRHAESPKIRLSAQVKADQVSKAILDVIFLDAQGESISHEWAAYIGAKEANDPPANHDWKAYSGIVKIPQDAKKIQIGLQIYGPGKVWFDDVRAEYAK